MISLNMYMAKFLKKGKPIYIGLFTIYSSVYYFNIVYIYVFMRNTVTFKFKHFEGNRFNGYLLAGSQFDFCIMFLKANETKYWISWMVCKLGRKTL